MNTPHRKHIPKVATCVRTLTMLSLGENSDTKIASTAENSANRSALTTDSQSRPVYMVLLMIPPASMNTAQMAPTYSALAPKICIV